MTREEAIKYLKQWNPINPAKKEAVEMAIDSLGQPQIVCCKNCRFYKQNKHGKGYCIGSCDALGYVDSDWYCADGEPKDGDNK